MSQMNSLAFFGSTAHQFSMEMIEYTASMLTH